MAWIEASAAGGGSTGGGNTIMVTCSESFAGLPITCTNGLTTKTLNCPSTAPYVIQFTDIVADEWTISGTIDGTTYSTTVEVGDIFTTVLESGFEWQTWVDLSQNYHSADYNSLAEVFADEGALHELMTIHACCDYLIGAVSDDINTIDDFCANDTAMKWIGLRDYVCDGLTAISGVVAKFLASEYWERYLKDHVPTMTANNAPFGVATSLSNQSGALAPFTTFDGIITSTSASYGAPAGNVKTAWWGFQFTNPINVKKAIFYALYSLASKTLTVTAKIQGSNDGTNWTDIGTARTFTINGQDLTPHEIDVPSNANYYLHQRLEISSDDYLGVQGSYAFHVTTLQFYGRSLNVSVPVMTSNTAPYGEVRSNSTYSPTNDYKPFGHSLSESDSTVYDQISNGVNIDYEFTSRIKPKMLTMKSRVGDYQLLTYKVSGAQDGAFEDIPLTSPSSIVDGYSYVIATLNPSKDYNIIRITPLTTSDNSAHTVAANLYWTAHAIQIYGLDYSEREFEPNSGKKWLYDHGLELETITTSGEVTKGSDYLTLSAANSEATASIDLTDYSILRCKVGDHMSGTTQLSVGGSNPATATLTSANAPNNFSLGTSLFDQTLATGVKMTANGICDITELWLEY